MDRSEWVLVPRDVTPEMWEAGMNCHSPDDTQGDYLDKVWPAMLAAAPPPPAEQASGEIQRWRATGDYAYPAEEDADGEFVAYDDHVAAIAALSQRPVVDEATKLYVGFDKNMEPRLFHLRDTAERHCIGNIDVYVKLLAPQQQGGAE